MFPQKNKLLKYSRVAPSDQQKSIPSKTLKPELKKN